MNYAIATLGSHSALQILKGAKDEGFKTICVCVKGAEEPYQSYRVADEFILVDSFKDYFKIEDQLIAQNAIMIPHGSFVSYLGWEKVQDIKVMHYGSKEILEWEADRGKMQFWMDRAGLKQPKVFTPETIDRPAIVKFNGAKGGSGYFIVNSPQEFALRIKNCPAGESYMIQEYIVGNPVYAHYFYSPITEELEVMGFDKRYESNADSLGRVPAKDQLNAGVEPTYTVVGNFPIVIRESLLPPVFKMGKAAVEASRQLVNSRAGKPIAKGLYGPFCLEMIIDSNLNFYVFEISARIVAGTNPYTGGSPYTWLRYNEPMSTGRRIARDIKQAIEQNRLEEILG